jgi:uncharacterized protein
MKINTQPDSHSERFIRWILAHRKSVIGVTLVLIFFSIAGLHNFVLNNDYGAFFDHNHPRMAAYEKTQGEYSTDDTVFFVVTANNGNIFERRVLEAIEYLTEESWKLPYATRVDSLTTYQHAFSEGDDLIVSPLVESVATMSDEALKEASIIAYSEPLLQNRLVKDGSPVTGVNVTIAVPKDVPRASIGITAAAEKLMADAAERFPEVTLRLTGVVPLNNAFLVAALQDVSLLVPAMLLIIVITMALLLKSFTLMIAVTIVVVFSSLSTVGILSWFNHEVAGPVTMLPLIVLILAVADCIHILTTIQSLMSKGMEKMDAIVESMRINMMPVFLTSFTTVIGFLSMMITPVPPIRTLGAFTAVGVTIAWLLAVFFLPTLISFLRFRVPPVKDNNAASRSAIEVLGEFVIARKKLVFIVLTAITLIIGINISSIGVNNQFVEWFDSKYPIRVNTEYAMNNLTGIYQLIFNVPARADGGMNEPEYLSNLDKFATWVRDQKGVVHVNSIADTMKRLNRAMHGDDPAMYTIPESREMAAQYLLLYEMSLPMGMALNTEVNIDKSASRMVVTTSNLRSEEITQMVENIEAWQHKNLPEYMFAPALGPAVMFAEVARTMMRSMMQNAPLSLFLVVIAMMIAMRSFWYGLLSLPPNLVPMAISFGFWGLMGKDMNFGMTTIVAMTVGIIVDYSIHFLSKYLRMRREENATAEDAVRYAFSTVGKPLWVTTFILVAGFSIMVLSPMAYCDNMGVLTSLIIIFALIGNLFYLPSLLVIIEGQQEEEYETAKELKNEETVIAFES